MTVSNEPGYYADGRFGIRIENVVLVTEAKTPNNFGDKGYLGFENVTMSVLIHFTYCGSLFSDAFSLSFRCPIQVKLINTDLLSPQEKSWVNAYHEEVFSKVSPLLQNNPRTLEWLKRECKNPI